MQSHWVNDAPYYRCRFPADDALANQVAHPLNVNLREDAMIGQVDQGLAREFVPHRLSETLRDLVAAQETSIRRVTGSDDVTRKIAECERKLTQYRAALDAGASAATVGAWIAETEAEKAGYQLSARHAPTRPRMGEAEIKAIVDKLADISAVLRTADPEDKAEIFRKLGLRLTYHPQRHLVESQIEVAPALANRECPRGDLNTPPGEISPDRGNFHVASIASGSQSASSGFR
jgi:site-specific DNA recombinase